MKQLFKSQNVSFEEFLFSFEFYNFYVWFVRQITETSIFMYYILLMQVF